MRRAWDGFAREDAMHYVLVRDAPWEAEEFLATGRAQAEWALGLAGAGVARGRALDLGCGLGRVSAALAAHFERVDGVDVSAAMIERARALSPPANVHLTVGSGEDLAGFPSGAYDVVLSLMVFQHVTDAAVLARYLEEVARVLAPRGAALLHFDTRPEHVGRRALMALPDPLLPRDRRRFIRRVRRDPEWVRARALDAGLRIESEHAPGSAEHLLVLRLARAG